MLHGIEKSLNDFRLYHEDKTLSVLLFGDHSFSIEVRTNDELYSVTMDYNVTFGDDAVRVSRCMWGRDDQQVVAYDDAELFFGKLDSDGYVPVEVFIELLNDLSEKTKLSPESIEQALCKKYALDSPVNADGCVLDDLGVSLD